MHYRRIRMVETVKMQRVALTDGRVVLVTDYPGGIVAFQLEHHRQRVAQVVLRQRHSQWQLTLGVAAYHATMQGDARLVPEVVTGYIF